MSNVLITVAMGLAFNLPNAVPGQQTEFGPRTMLGRHTELAVQPGDLIQLRISGAIRNSGFFDVAPTVTVSEAMPMAGWPALLGQRDKVWVFQNGEIITTILGGETQIADSPI
jgi:hypothetical protein